jgi:hypothetical protein
MDGLSGTEAQIAPVGGNIGAFVAIVSAMYPLGLIH